MVLKRLWLWVLFALCGHRVLALVKENASTSDFSSSVASIVSSSASSTFSSTSRMREPAVVIFFVAVCMLCLMFPGNNNANTEGTP